MTDSMSPPALSRIVDVGYVDIGGDESFELVPVDYPVLVLVLVRAGEADDAGTLTLVFFSTVGGVAEVNHRPFGARRAWHSHRHSVACHTAIPIRLKEPDPARSRAVDPLVARGLALGGSVRSGSCTRTTTRRLGSVPPAGGCGVAPTPHTSGIGHDGRRCRLPRTRRRRYPANLQTKPGALLAAASTAS